MKVMLARLVCLVMMLLVRSYNMNMMCSKNYDYDHDDKVIFGFPSKGISIHPMELLFLLLFLFPARHYCHDRLYIGSVPVVEIVLPTDTNPIRSERVPSIVELVKHNNYYSRLSLHNRRRRRCRPAPLLFRSHYRRRLYPCIHSCIRLRLRFDV